MLTRLISKKTVAEIGKSVSEVFKVPIAIANPEGTLLFMSDNWSQTAEILTPDFIKYSLRMLRSGDKPIKGIFGGEPVAVIPIRSGSKDYAYGILDLNAAHVSMGEEQVAWFVEKLRKTLGDISIYAGQKIDKELNDIKSEAGKTGRLFQRGLASHDEVLKSFLDNIRNVCGAKIALIASSAKSFEAFEPAYVSGDGELVPECMNRCGLGCWSLYVKQPVLVNNPQNDSRCCREGPAGDFKAVAAWPLFMKDKSFGILYLAGLPEKSIKPWQQDYIDTMSVFISFILDIKQSGSLNSGGLYYEDREFSGEDNDTLVKSIKALSLTIKAYDPMTFRHSKKVRELAIALAETMGLPENEIFIIGAAALLHDIGKISVPQSILHKPGYLTAREYEELKKHAAVGAEIINTVNLLEPVGELVRYHHEAFGGGGYPSGLRGEQIPFGARILAVADTFAALVAKRPYRVAKEPFEAMEIIKANAGNQFDPKLVKVFENIVRQRYALQYKH